MGKKICSRCIYDETVPNITFDDSGVCNYCKMIDGLQAEYKTGTPEGEQEFMRLVQEMKEAGKDKKYDCVIGLSGGTDSCYLLHLAVKEWGLRPLAANYDNHWASDAALQNMEKVAGKLGVPIYRYQVDEAEANDIFKAFLKAGVPELDGPTDIALTEVLYRAADDNDIKYILDGHSFKTEGVSPLGIMYIDGKYIDVIHRKFGKMKPKTFPNMMMGAFLKWTIFKKLKRIRPLWYIGYSKENAREFLQKEYGWQYYGGHHLENKMTAFHHSIYHPQRFGIDQRNNSLSASVRSGFMSREKALEEYEKPPYVEPGLVDTFKKRLQLTDAEYEQLMAAPKKYFWDYETYKKTFERMRPLFYVLYKAHLVPKSFYLKYCFPLPLPKMN
jgi:N-acetyl sugar amidotransferase